MKMKKKKNRSVRPIDDDERGGKCVGGWAEKVCKQTGRRICKDGGLQESGRTALLDVHGLHEKFRHTWTQSVSVRWKGKGERARTLFWQSCTHARKGARELTLVAAALGRQRWRRPSGGAGTSAVKRAAFCSAFYLFSFMLSTLCLIFCGGKKAGEGGSTHVMSAVCMHIVTWVGNGAANMF